MRRAEGYVESGPHDVDGEPHWVFWFPSIGNRDVWSAIISQAVLAEAGVDFTEDFEVGLRTVVAADINFEATTPDELHPQNLEFVGFLPRLDQKDGWWTRDSQPWHPDDTRDNTTDSTDV